MFLPNCFNLIEFYFLVIMKLHLQLLHLFIRQIIEVYSQLLKLCLLQLNRLILVILHVIPDDLIKFQSLVIIKLHSQFHHLSLNRQINEFNVLR